MTKPEPVGLLEIEYVQHCLNQALEQLPPLVYEELSRDWWIELGTSVAATETRIGYCDRVKMTLVFHGPVIKATPVGRLPAEVAAICARAWMWRRGDVFFYDPRRIGRWLREWGFPVEEGAG